MKSMQELWTVGKCPLVNGIVHATGMITLIELDPLKQNHRPKGHLVTGKTVSLSDLELAGSLECTFYTEMCELVDSSLGLHMVAGGAGMGGDGFVALLSSPTEILQWIAFFDFANPFVKVDLANRFVNAVNNLGEKWSFPIDAPELVVVS